MKIKDMLNEEKPREKDKKAALTIYYADEGEELWNIAKKYCTSVEKIQNENEIDTDVDKLQGRNMLFIPM
jgi:LysM repeat protein